MSDLPGLYGSDIFKPVETCRTDGRENETIVADLDGTLLRARSPFPYFLLVALEGGSLLRAIVLFIFSPLAWLLYHFVSEAAGIRVLIFFTFAGLRERDIEIVARAVLPKFYAEDVHEESWRVFSSCGKRYIITANPRIMVEHFAKNILGVFKVIGTEIGVNAEGYATGFVRFPGVLVGLNKRNALKSEFGHEVPDIGLGDRMSDYAFMSLCKEAYMVPKKKVKAVPCHELEQPVIFHDGKLVQRPTPLVALLIFLWLPMGFALATFRILLAATVPVQYVPLFYKLVGIRFKVKGARPPKPRTGDPGILFVCTHRTLVDPIMVCAASGRNVTALTYSISRVSELLSPIQTFPLSRDREKDAANIKALLKNGDLCICPEGTTCREPYLLRFSALFAELSDRIIPVATSAKLGVFHGTTARGWKGMDPFFVFMNPFPSYEVTFLNKLPFEMTVKGGKSPLEIANHVQRELADVLGFKCTQYTRKDKYDMLVGSNGNVPFIKRHCL